MTAAPRTPAQPALVWAGIALIGIVLLALPFALAAAGTAWVRIANLAILFVPAFNADGHERFARWNRPNQRGPEETGWRTTARNLNLNRDYTKSDAPEMQAMLRLIREWDPLICGDLHVTDGASTDGDPEQLATSGICWEPLHA